MDTKFTQVLKSGGNGTFVVTNKIDWHGARQDCNSSKAGFEGDAQLRQQFQQSLTWVDLINLNLFQSFVGDGLGEPKNDNLADVSGEKAAALKE